MREIVNINVGQSGIQIGGMQLAGLAQEHKVNLDGEYVGTQPDLELMRIDSYLREVQEGKYVPRSINIDLDPQTIDKQLVGPLSGFLTPENFVVGNENSEGVYSKVFYELGPSIWEEAQSKFRKMLEECETP